MPALSGNVLLLRRSVLHLWQEGLAIHRSMNHPERFRAIVLRFVVLRVSGGHPVVPAPMNRAPMVRAALDAPPPVPLQVLLVFCLPGAVQCSANDSPILPAGRRLWH